MVVRSTAARLLVHARDAQLRRKSLSTDKRKPGEPISDLRLQTLIDIHHQKYVRERGDLNTFDVHAALVELQAMRRTLKQWERAS